MHYHCSEPKLMMCNIKIDYNLIRRLRKPVHSWILITYPSHSNMLKEEMNDVLLTKYFNGIDAED